MRKLAPVFITTSILAFAAGSALAASPTVSPNTNQLNNQSYSDKSSTSPGTNATMDDANKPMAMTDEDKNLKHTKKKMKKANVAARTDPAVKPAPTLESNVSATTPAKDTGATAANSTTGKSTGQ